MRRSAQAGFTLFELLVVLGIIGIMWGMSMNFMPRLLSGSDTDGLARQLAGAGLEARQMALLQQRPWEVLLDLDEKKFYCAPVGAVSRRELRANPLPGEGAAGMLLRTESGTEGNPTARDENKENLTTLRKQSVYDISKTFTAADDDADIRENLLPDAVRVSRVQVQDPQGTDGGRVSIVFSPRGVSRPTVVWLDDEESNPASRRTLFFPGLLPPRVETGHLLPDINGNLISSGGDS